MPNVQNPSPNHYTNSVNLEAANQPLASSRLNKNRLREGGSERKNEIWRQSEGEREEEREGVTERERERERQTDRERERKRVRE